LTPAIRETVDAVTEWDFAISQAALSKRLGISRSAMCDRVGKALEGGWLINEAKRGSRTMRLRRGERMPDPVTALPSVDDVRALFGSSGENQMVQGEVSVAAVESAKGEGSTRSPEEAPAQLTRYPPDRTAARRRSPRFH